MCLVGLRLPKKAWEDIGQYKDIIKVYLWGVSLNNLHLFVFPYYKPVSNDHKLLSFLLLFLDLRCRELSINFLIHSML